MSVAETAERQASGEGVRTLTASDVVALVGGTLDGDPGVHVRRIAPIDRAGPGDVTFVATARYGRLLETSRASLVLISPELARSLGPRLGPARIVVTRPHEAVLALLPVLYRLPMRTAGIHETAQIGRGAIIGRNVSIGPYVVLGDGVTIGADCQLDAHVVVADGVQMGNACHLYPQVTVYSGSQLGDRVTLHAGVRVGSDGFGYVFRDGLHDKIPHVGRCLIGNDVEVGANTTIDRGSIDDTVVGDGTKIDNLVQIGHNVRVGRLCLLMAQVGISGSTHIGDGCILAGQVGVAGHITIGQGARVAAQAGVTGNVPAGETWSGYPARPHREALRSQAALFKLAGLWRRVERLLEGKST
ncbi:MAG: UDP-3-O-acylglucosamine N-acyltransferase [Gemmatimonadaceae bacterium]|nr:UDP-3-O-acylglucosamine N-acyltransferase [Gemmatimonadaceae bacterium]